MIVLISPEKDIPKEIKILHQLFDAGLEFYHLRKPDKNEAEFKSYLQDIDKKYYKNIVIHQFHHMAREFGLKGIHLQEQFRIDLGKGLEEYADSYKNSPKESSTNTQHLTPNAYIVSSSFHHPDTIKQCAVEFDYHLLSPIFNAISKVGYEGRGFEVHDINKKVIGMGGVTADNLEEIKAKGFQGAGVLGGVWKAENPLEAFIKMNNKAIF